jgi:hypothetical protein
MKMYDIDPEALQRMVAEVRQASETIEDSFRANPLPSPEVLRGLADEHRRYLDTLDREYGPPSQDDVNAAQELIKELKPGT